MIQVILIVTLVLGGYFLFAFVGLRLVAPFMGFSQAEPPREISAEIKQTVVNLENKSSDQISFLENVYNFILEKNKNQWRHTRGRAAVMLPRLFVKDLNDIWQTKEFVYCNAINFLAFSMLVSSKYFKFTDVKVKYVFLNFVLHQYLQVKVGEEWVDFDPSGSGIRGGLLGTHARFFG